jgi:type 1 glutamine amidotransferase
MLRRIHFRLVPVAAALAAAFVPALAADAPENIAQLKGDVGKPHVVFVTGDEEYRSEETMPMLARILHRDHGFTVSVCFALTDGVIDPNRIDHIEGLEILAGADMMVMATRFRKLPDDQLKHITAFAESGKPMAGFRTATHAFKYGGGDKMDKEWPQKVFGLPWISHHGGGNSTDVLLVEQNAAHPVLRGVSPFHARSWLYHSDTLLKSATPLLTGRAVKGAEPGGEHFSDPHTVAWVHHYEGEKGKSRVFFTTLGHPSDFKHESMRKLSLNGILWALGMEDAIPQAGSKADFAAPYEPNNAGFGKQFKPGLKPADMLVE